MTKYTMMSRMSGKVRAKSGLVPIAVNSCSRYGCLWLLRIIRWRQVVDLIDVRVS